MITPDKYLDLKLSIINVSAHVIQALGKIKILSFSELENEVCKQLGQEARPIVAYSLNFLFLLDKIEYNNGIDSFSIKK
jgi:hypothetical protein